MLSEEYQKDPRLMARKLAAEVRKRHKAIEYPIDVKAIAEAEGASIETVYLVAGDGLLSRTNAGYIISVNERLPATRQRFTIAHELGHLLIERMVAEASENPEAPLIMFTSLALEERFCQWFAGHLLIPEGIIRSLKKWEAISITGLLSLAYDLQVSFHALAWHILEILPDKGYILIFAIHDREDKTGRKYFDLELERTVYPKVKRKMLLTRGAVLSSDTDLYKAIVALRARASSTQSGLEEPLSDVAVKIGNFEGQGSVRIRVRSTTVWVLVIPPSFHPNCVQLSLFP